MKQRMLLGVIALVGLSGPVLGQAPTSAISINYSEPKAIRVVGQGTEAVTEVLSMPIRVTSRVADSGSLPASTDAPKSSTVADAPGAASLPNGSGSSCSGDSCLTGNCCDVGGICGPCGRVWFGAEYLGWWTNGFCLPPLVTTSPQGTPRAAAGVLGQPGTTVLFGDSRVDDGYRSGARFTLGTWLNQCQTIGVEANVFFLANETTSFSASSTGNPILAIPFFDVNPARTGENSFKIAYPGFSRGSYEATTFSELWGTEVNFLYNLCCGCCYRVDALGGFRFIHLHENFTSHDTEIATALPFPVEFDISDRFSTTNNFYGGQLGLRGEYRYCNWFVQATGKVAIGTTYRTVNIDGTTSSIVVTPQPVQVGGIFALPSNMGSHNDCGFSVVPEVGLNLGYQLTKNLRATVGYTFLYWSNVTRPGNHIDTTINTSQPPLGLGLAGAARPAFNNNTTDFWAQGFNLGMEFRY